MTQLLGIDLGSSSLKASVVDAESGEVLAHSSAPKSEMHISAPAPGFAEQNPNDWWNYCVEAVREVGRNPKVHKSELAAIGISYQMHGLVCMKDGAPLRPAIIWCDSRAVKTGELLRSRLESSYLERNLLNSPSNLTLSKLVWVKEHEPEIFDELQCVMLPGDYLAYRLTGESKTTSAGLSEGIMWDFQSGGLADGILSAAGVPQNLICPTAPIFGVQGIVSDAASKELGIKPGIPVSYRAGDQPNNALSLNVLQPGEAATVAGTSGVIYAVSDKPIYDSLGRINTFMHVNSTVESPRFGVLMCINGAAISNRWIRELAGSELTYEEIDQLASAVPVGSDGVTIIPFGNGAERTLENREHGAKLSGIDFNRHNRNFLFRATQEGVAFAFRFGAEILRELGVPLLRIRSGHANMFLSPVFCEAVVNSLNVPLDIFETDGAAGAALGAGFGAGVFPSLKEALSKLKPIRSLTSEPDLVAKYESAYQRWRIAL